MKKCPRNRGNFNFNFNFNVLVAASTAKPDKEKDWPRLAEQVKAFAKSNNKWDKHRWFASQGIDATEFLPSTSLPDCAARANCRPYPHQVLVNRWKARAQAQQSSLDGLPTELVAIVRAFLQALDAGVGVEALKQMMDVGLSDLALGQALSLGDNCPALFAAQLEFGFGRLFANGSGAHHPLSVCELAAKIRSKDGVRVSCQEAAKAIRDAADTALPRGPGLELLRGPIGTLPIFTFSAARDSREKGIVAEAHFVHLPRDKLVLRADYVMVKGKSEAKIVSALWAPSE